jgi:hypothetical protein
VGLWELWASGQRCHSLLLVHLLSQSVSQSVSCLSVCQQTIREPVLTKSKL